MRQNMNFDLGLLDRVSVDIEKLATNYPDVIPDCTGAGAEVKTELINRFPLVVWLLNTALTQRVRAAVRENGLCMTHRDSNGKWVMEVPRSVWTELPESTQTECCWQPFDFAKCAGNVPLNLLCLKDCVNIMDELVGRNVRTTTGLDGVANANESIEATRARVARLSMAFLTAYNVILGVDNTYTDILKPFHGLLSVMSNAAVAQIYGGNILAAFDSAYCRIAILGGQPSDYAFAVNPVMYQSIMSQIVPGANGQLPYGWTRDGDSIRFHGISFIQDKLVPVDLTSGTGTVWVLNREAVGLYLATDLMPADSFVKRSGHQGASIQDGCGNECTYYYNYGAAFNNNANKIMQIVDMPISGTCASAITDLGALIAPKTLIPEA